MGTRTELAIESPGDERSLWPLLVVTFRQYVPLQIAEVHRLVIDDLDRPLHPGAGQCPCGGVADGAGAGQNDAADVPMDIPVVSSPFAGIGNGDLAFAVQFRSGQEHVSEHVGRRHTGRQPRPERVVTRPASLRIMCRQLGAPALGSREHGSSGLPARTRCTDDHLYCRLPRQVDTRVDSARQRTDVVPDATFSLLAKTLWHGSSRRMSNHGVFQHWG